ncbi:HET-domain-containing protein [Byssothecium circinans]|uniref:HET-domain-containing protein n=1 Tax=Byssothecium circinans TaxID=147558 RepID=A0A6A5TNV5_9PLEO|nr:HET-domain-containing protein [Byssothecium circinans]
MLSARREQLHPRRSQPRRRVSAASVLGFDLCKRCKRINLDTAFRRKHLTKFGKPLCELGPTRDWSVNSCSLCQLMLQLVPAQERGSERHVLRSLSSNRIPERGWQAIDTTMLAIDGSSAFLLKQPEHLSVVRLIQPNINPELVKGWLNYCQDNHSSACSAGDGPLSSESTTSPLSTIISFKVIDCETRRIVDGCRAQYVALSYVWGAGERGPEFSRVLPPQLPETIEDAITITRSLNMRYLWIDRFCINQSEPSEVREQVGQMDLIYSCACLTIIAAAGATPNHGLPGVGERYRPAQPQGIVRGHTLVSTLPDPRDTIKHSKWFQRGWTYQEGILSPRRLIFTDYQVYFECSGMYCCEALDFPLRSLHTQNGQRFQAKFCDKFNIGMFPRGIGTSAWEVVQRIEDYSTRQLTNPSDILNGISGILQAFKRSRKRVLHCAGMPMIPATPKRRSGWESEPRVREWTPLTGFCGGLCWGVVSPSERREGFPSWSWTGWRSKIRWEIRDYSWHYVEPNKDLQLSIQLEDGRVVDLETFCHSYDDMSMNISDTLHIATWTFSLRIWRSRTLWSRLQYEAILELEGKEPYVWSFAPTCTTPILTNTNCIGIHLCHTTEGQSLYVLVIREVKNGVYERVGFGEMDGNMEMVSENKTRTSNRLKSVWLPRPTPKKVTPKKVWKEFQLR